METLYAIIIIGFAIFFYILIYIMRKMAKLKEQNDRIYEDNLDVHKIENTYPVRLEEDDIPYDFEFEDTSIEGIDMSARLRNCLNAFFGVHGVYEDLEYLTLFTKQQLLNFKHLGKKSLEELENLMNEHNLKFKENGK